MIIKTQGFATEQNLDNLTHALAAISILVLLVCTAINLDALADISWWRHDELYYQPDYFHKVESEGRWLNYLLSNYLPKLPGFAHILINYFALALFCITAAWRTNRDFPVALVIALACLQAPFFSTQLQWPATTLPGFLVLLAACILCGRIPKIIFFPIFGILFFATLSHLYFLLPLLFLKDLDLRKAANLLVLWIASFVIGFAVTQAITFKLTGHFIEIMAWRNPNPIQSWDDFFLNLNRVFDAFIRVNVKLFQMMGLAITTGCGLALLIGRKSSDFYMLVVILLSATAVFASSLPLGLGVADRTALIYAIALIFLVCIRENPSTQMRSIVLILCTSIGVALAVSNLKTINWYAGVTSELKEEMQRAIPYSVSNKATIVLGISKKDWKKITRKIEICKDLTHITGEKFNGGYRVKPALVELGFKNVAWCGKCETVPVKVSVTVDNCERKIFEAYRNKPNEIWLLAAEGYLR